MTRVAAFCVMVLGSVFVLNHVLAQGTDEFPKGTFTAKVKESEVSLQFDGKGKYLVIVMGKNVVEGTYKVTKDEVEFTGVKGPKEIKEDEKTGTYKWKLEDKKLTFKKVADKNTGREQTLTSGPWVMK